MSSQALLVCGITAFIMWYTAFLSALLLAQCTEGFWIHREMSTKPLRDMTETDIQQLSTVIMADFRNAGFVCPERARSMITFGLVMHKIPISFPHVRQLVFGSTAMVPASVQDEITQKVIDDVVIAYAKGMETMPEYFKLAQDLGSFGRRYGVVKSHIDAARVWTGADVISHMRDIMASLKSTTCNTMTTINSLETFMTKVAALLNTQGDVILNQKVIGSIRDKVHIVIPNDDIARRVIAQVVPTTKWIIQDMHDTVLAMAQVVPYKLPIEVFLRNWVTMYQPQIVDPIIGVEPAASISPVFQFPMESNPCYAQKVAAYYTVLLRMFSSMRVNIIDNLLMGHVKDAAICKPLSRLIKYDVMEIMPESIVAALKPITAEWWKLRTSMIELKRAGQLNGVTIVDPFNSLLNVISGPKMCAIKPDMLVSIVSSAFNTYQQTIETDAVAKYLQGKIAVPEMAEFMAVYKPMAQAFKVAFNAMYADYQVKALTEKPIFAILKMFKYVDVDPVWWNQGGCMRAYAPSHASFEAATTFKPSMFNKIGSKFAHILSGILEGDINRPLDVSMIGSITEQTVDTIVNAAQADVYVDEGIEDVLSTWGSVPMETVPSDVVIKTMMAISRKLQHQVPSECRLPLGIKFLAALISGQQQMMVSGPDYPLVPLLAPVIQAVNPASPIPLEKVKEIVRIFAYQLHMASVKAMANLGIFKGMGPVTNLVNVIIKDVMPGAPLLDIYRKSLPHLSAFVHEGMMCTGMSFDNVLADGYTYMDRLFNSPELTVPSLDAVLSGIIPAVIRKPIINALVTSGLRLIEGGVRRFMWRATPIVKADPLFAKYHPRYPVGANALDIAPVGGFIKPHVYKLFLEELKTRLISQLVPITHLPVEVLHIRLAEAYMRTLRILGIPL